MCSQSGVTCWKWLYRPVRKQIITAIASQRPITVATRGWWRGDENEFSVGGAGSFMSSITTQESPALEVMNPYCSRTVAPHASGSPAATEATANRRRRQLSRQYEPGR